ncbi:SAM-dependent methyltransferase [Paenibacillus sp. CAA11]|uniref:class I SAM-dependent methyltransferase n=1 Tax=Paenibacillus sp. CAA11 TaxID=1532905 RepID=UPI000D38D87F|nr:class I SAM-dependent methyltransferase [Paenibacillus sp. CAA11]AWB44891.1 SAM-dependent methyltransferase [Paenibacillus sp. CAA11]
MIITTGDHEAQGSVQRALQIAAGTGLRYVRRSGLSLSKLRKKYNDPDILIVLENGIRIAGEDGEPMFFHPSMSFVRAKRLLKGGKDLMLEAAGVVPGDRIIDCTAGLGADSIIFSMGSGPLGEVVSLESSFPLYMLLREGLASYHSGLKEFDEALSRIEVRHGHHLDWLKQMPDQSADIVYFDPMFREPTTESSSISPLRSYANLDQISLEAIAEARRVARKAVVLKEKRDSGEFTRLGFDLPDRSRSKITYGVMRLDS